MRLRLGTRGSALAMQQATDVARRLEALGHEVEIAIVRTTGDQRHDVPLADIGGKGLFIKELEEALARGEIDLAVHSLKDVPAVLPGGFVLAAFLERADPRDVWIGAPIEAGARLRVGTSSPRRRAQLLARMPHLTVESIRGNVDTRIEKVRRGEYDAIVLAAAGLARLGRTGEVTRYFDVDEMVPAAGQGIVAIETTDSPVCEVVAPLNVVESERIARCERGVLLRFSIPLDCYSPVAVHATLDNGEITIRGFYQDRWTRQSGHDADALIEQVAHELSAAPKVGSGAPTSSSARQDAGAPLRSGVVYLVGAGPGDARLLTLRAAELLERADVVAVDALVSQDIVERIPKSARVIFVGKRAGAHAVPQSEINRLLIEEAKKGLTVVRLKGGDPFVFGRGGEEAEELAAAGIPFEVVPGVTSATAGPAYAGIAVTHRDYATSLTIVTAHESDESTGIRWEALARFDGTIVFLMGFANLPLIVSKLREQGVAATRPIAVISKATMPEQRTVTGTLDDIEERVEVAKLETPALVVVGDVVALREKIGWFESKPLFGKRIVITRARQQASELKRLLEDAGASVLQFPAIEIVPPESFESLDRAVDVLSDYQWIIFTSPNGVRGFFERLRHYGKDARAFHGVSVAAVGATTAQELELQGVVPDLVPSKFQSASLLPLLEVDQRGMRTAVVRAEQGRDELIDELRRRGGEVDLVVAYRTVAVEHDLEHLGRLIAGEAIDVVTFASGSSVDNFFSRLTATERERLAARALFASIGPATSEVIRRYARDPDIEAPNATLEALRDTIVARFRS